HSPSWLHSCCDSSGAHRDLHSFPTRRSSDLEGLHQDRLRLILGADDPDHLVDVEIGDQIAAQDLQPVLDLLLAVVRAPQQHVTRSEEHTSELQSRENLVCRLLLEKKKKTNTT